MRTQRILETLLLLALLPTTLTTWLAVPVKAATLLVPQQYPTIQAAVNAAKAGDTIQVAAGTYYENVVVSTQVIIVGENALTTIVDGRGRDTVFNIQADNVELRQLTIRNGGRNYLGVKVYYPYGGVVIRYNRIRDSRVGVILSESNGNTVESNVLMNNSMYGVTVRDYSTSNTVRNNSISESAYGIELSETSSGQVVNNTVSGASYGVYVAYSNNNNVSSNTLTNNSWNMYFTYSNSNVVGKNDVSGGTVGIQVMRSQGNSVINNTVSTQSYGIYLGYCGANTVSGNTAKLNDWGIELYNSIGSTIKENMIKDNTWGFYLAVNSNANYIYHNNIVNNVQQAFQDLTSSTNTWNTPTTPYQGNYWSDYRGSDTNNDGIGDTYLPWAGVDYYPLMRLFGVRPDVAIMSVTPARDRTYLGLSINITVVAKNLGTTTETFDVTAYYAQSVIGTQTVASLAPGASATLIFTWNTTGVSVGYYVISARATTVPFEVDTTNNYLTDGTIYVKIPGDINGDGRVDIFDGILLSANYGRPAAEFPDGDINGDGNINVLDAIILSSNWTG